MNAILNTLVSSDNSTTCPTTFSISLGSIRGNVILFTSTSSNPIMDTGSNALRLNIAISIVETITPNIEIII